MLTAIAAYVWGLSLGLIVGAVWASARAARRRRTVFVGRIVPRERAPGPAPTPAVRVDRALVEYVHEARCRALGSSSRWAA